MSWKNNRPDGWIKERSIFFERHQPKKPYYKTRETDYEAGADAIAKQILFSVGKEAHRLDKSVYLVPDYHKYREALKEMGIE